MLYRILGDNGFRKLHSMAVSLDHSMTSEELQSFAEEIQGQKLTGLFNGWVFPWKAVIIWIWVR